VTLSLGVLPARKLPPAELYQWVRRDEEYAILGANVVVELNSESRARKPTTRAWATIRRADRSHRLTSQRASRPDRRHADQTDRSSNPGARDDGRYPLTPTARPDRGGDPGECGAWAGWPFRAGWRPWPSGWGYLRPWPGFRPLRSQTPSALRSTYDPSPGGLAKQELAGCGVGGRLPVLRLAWR
jgi:hypothetical protein